MLYLLIVTALFLTAGCRSDAAPAVQQQSSANPASISQRSGQRSASGEDYSVRTRIGFRSRKYLDEHFAEPLLSIRSLFRDEQRRILNVLCDATLSEAEGAFRQLHERYDPLTRFHAALGVPLPKVLRTAAEFDVNMQLRRMATAEEVPLGEMESRLREARDEQVVLDETTLMSLTRAVERAAADVARDPEDAELLERWETLVEVVRESGIAVDLRRPQNDYYRLKKTVRPLVAANAGNGSSSATRWLQHFDALGEKLSISPASRE